MGQLQHGKRFRVKMKKNKKRYDLYMTHGDFSEFCYRFNKKDDALISLGAIIGSGEIGYIEEVTFEVVESYRRIDAVDI